MPPKTNPAHRVPYYSTLRDRVAELEQTLAAWQAKLENPNTAIQWRRSDTGEWADESLAMKYWGVELSRRIKQETDDDTT